MRRREFITLIGGMAASWPISARAQKSTMPVIGFLHIGTEDAYTNDAVAAFGHGLQEVGYAEGRNVSIEYSMS
jgi:putative tryptophan/tyrosine transport system substrate-binding protein